MFTAGDPSTIPPNTVRRLRNYSVRPDGGGLRLDCRAPFVYDGLDTVSGFAVWQDLVNDLTKTVAIRSTDQKIYTKNTNGSAYGAGVSGIPTATRLTSYTNFLNKLYMMFDNGAGVPSGTATWDGTTLVTAPFNSTLYSRVITSYIGRLFFIDPRVTVTNLASQSNYVYDWSSATKAHLISCNFQNVVSTGATVGRVFITAASGAKVEFYQSGGATNVGVTSIAASATAVPLVWRQDLRGVSGTYLLPVKFEILLMTSWSNNGGAGIVWVAGDLINDGTNLQRCTTGGTGGTGAAPAWATTVGATTADGSAVWKLEQTGNTIGILDNQYVLSVQGSGQWMTYFCTGSVPAATNAQQVGMRLSFGNSATPSVTLCAVDVSLKDGITDGDLRKQNYGLQLTQGDFYYPFFNQESTFVATVNVDALVWSEINNARQVLAKNTFPLSEIAGVATAAIVANGRLVVAKRKGMWIFKGVADINEPILPETSALPYGIIGPLAVDVARDGTMFWISEQHVCSMKVGTETTPKFIDSPGFYEELMVRTSGSWVESQSTYNQPLLAIDHTNRDVWVYTLKGVICIYNIDTAAWSYYDTNPTGTSSEVQAMMFDPVGNRMIVSFGGGSATRLDETSNQQDTIITGGLTPWNVQSDITLKPFELFAPRYEATLLELGLYHIATIQQGSLTLSYSFDRGSTYTTPSGYPITTYLTTPRIRLPLAATGPSVTIKLSRTGAGGQHNWSISKADALLRVHRGELPYVNST